MGKETKVKTIDVFCREGHLVFEHYRKVGGGRLQKLYRDEIGQDLTESSKLPQNAVIFCRQCEPPRPVASVEMIHGRVAYKVIQSGIRKVVT
jgi:hypothetical protein